MLSVLQSQIGLLEQEPLLPNASEVEDLIAFYLTALVRLESHLGAGGLSERDRSLVPQFKRWLSAAGKVKEMARSLRGSGETINGYEELLRAMNRSKPVAVDFERFVELNSRLATEQSALRCGVRNANHYSPHASVS